MEGFGDKGGTGSGTVARPVGVDDVEAMSLPCDAETEEAAGEGGGERVGGSEAGERTDQEGDAIVAINICGVIGPEHGIMGEVECITCLPDPKFDVSLSVDDAGMGGAINPSFLEADDIEAGCMPDLNEGGYNNSR